MANDENRVKYIPRRSIKYDSVPCVVCLFSITILEILSHRYGIYGDRYEGCVWIPKIGCVDNISLYK